MTHLENFNYTTEIPKQLTGKEKIEFQNENFGMAINMIFTRIDQEKGLDKFWGNFDERTAKFESEWKTFSIISTKEWWLIITIKTPDKEIKFTKDLQTGKILLFENNQQIWEIENNKFKHFKNIDTENEASVKEEEDFLKEYAEILFPLVDKIVDYTINS